jgi:hypothetical protein
MPEPTIEVDYGVLAAKVSELQRIKAGLDAWQSGNRVTGMFGAVGDSGLEDELNSFHGGWHDGVDEIGKNLDGAIGFLRSACEQYRCADDSVARSTGKGGA